MTSDYAVSKAFYTELFGWTFEQSGADFGDYVTFSKDGESVAGMMHNQPDSGTPDVWSTYFATEDVGATVEAAKIAGAVEFLPPTAVGDVGQMAVLGDTSGGVFGLWQAGTHTGFNRYNEAGAVAWNEYHSKNFTASTAFYGSVFGWGWEVAGDTDDFRYRSATVDGHGVAGMMDSVGFLPAEIPSHWTIYFEVDDADASIARALELGGSLVRPAEDTPFGRLADLLDPTGANFKFHQETPGNI